MTFFIDILFIVFQVCVISYIIRYFIEILTGVESYGIDGVFSMLMYSTIIVVAISFLLYGASRVSKINCGYNTFFLNIYMIIRYFTEIKAIFASMAHHPVRRPFICLNNCGCSFHFTKPIVSIIFAGYW